jgi:hypothetical protein
MKTLIRLFTAVVFLFVQTAYSQEQRIYSQFHAENEAITMNLINREALLGAYESIILNYAKTFDLASAEGRFNELMSRFKREDKTTELNGLLQKAKNTEEKMLTFLNLVTADYREIVAAQVKDIEFFQSRIGSALQYQTQQIVQILTKSKAAREKAFNDLSATINQHHFQAALTGGAKGAAIAIAGIGVVAISAMLIKAFAVQLIFLAGGMILMATVILAPIAVAIALTSSSSDIEYAKRNLKAMVKKFPWGKFAGASGALAFLIGSVSHYIESKDSLKGFETLRDELKSVIVTDDTALSLEEIHFPI